MSFLKRGDVCSRHFGLLSRFAIVVLCKGPVWLDSWWLAFEFVQELRAFGLLMFIAVRLFMGDYQKCSLFVIASLQYCFT